MRARPGAPVAFEAAYGWGWLAELLDELSLEPHLVHPSRCKAIAAARLKDDRVDARTLTQLRGHSTRPTAANQTALTGIPGQPDQARPY
jgi:transposase